MFENQPKGLWILSLANTGERFGYYTMLAVFALFLGENFGFSAGTASEIYTWFLTAVYFLPLIGGMAADKWGYNKMVVIGIFIMFLGYLFLSIPLGSGTTAIAAMGAALLLVGLGTGFFKGNLQVVIGDLYSDPRYAGQRDSGFCLQRPGGNLRGRKPEGWRTGGGKLPRTEWRMYSVLVGEYRRSVQESCRQSAVPHR